MYKEQYTEKQIAELNAQKYKTYKKMHDNHKIAMRNNFFLEAICLEYAIAEDRINAVCRCFDDKAWNPDPPKSSVYRKSLRAKINMLKDNPIYKDNNHFMERLSLELIDSINEWADKRNEYLHHLAYHPFDDDTLRSIAEQGESLIKELNGAVKRVQNYFKKHPIL